MLIMMQMDIDLRNYLQQSYNKLTWEKRILFTFNIIDSLVIIHYENSVHRDLHSGNILQRNGDWCISDLGFCGPADKLSEKTYGNLPYIAPEVLVGKEYTFKSDIYSIGMLMWEISSGRPPFANHKHDYDLVLNIVKGIRPKIIPGTPLKYKTLMEQCQDADPEKRPDIWTLYNKIKEIGQIYYQDTLIKNKIIFKKFFKNFKSSQPKTSNNSGTNNLEIYNSSNLYTSKLYQFESLPESRNATKGKLN